MIQTPSTPDPSTRRIVTEILATQACRAPESLALSDKVADLGLDSLGMAEVIFAIEERFDVAVPFDGVETDARGLDLTTVGGVIAAVEALIAAQAAA